MSSGRRHILRKARLMNCARNSESRRRTPKLTSSSAARSASISPRIISGVDSKADGCDCGSSADRVGAVKCQAETVRGLPGDGAVAPLAFACDCEKDLIRNADGTLDLNAGAVLRDVAHDAIDRRAAAIEDNLAAKKRATALLRSAFEHGWCSRSGSNLHQCKALQRPIEERLKHSPQFDCDEISFKSDGTADGCFVSNNLSRVTSSRNCETINKQAGLPLKAYMSQDDLRPPPDVLTRLHYRLRIDALSSRR